MSVFRRTYTSAKGKSKSIQKWSVEFRDHDNAIRRIAAFIERAAGGKSLLSHVQEWRLAMEAKGNCVRHIRGFLANLKRLMNGCARRTITDIAVPGLNQWIAEANAANKAASTLNHHIRTGKAFCAWLVKGKRVSENSLGHVPLLNYTVRGPKL